MSKLNRELLDSYINKYLDDGIEYLEKPSKELVEQWLDAKIEAHEQINKIIENNYYDLCYGKLNDGEFEYEITPCNFIMDFDKQFHIYKGIEYLSELLEISLLHKGREDYFLYKGYNVFQLSKQEQ